MFAKLGFEAHEAGPILSGHIRVNLGKGHDYEWSHFTTTVEKFLGHPQRRLFNKLT